VIVWGGYAVLTGIIWRWLIVRGPERRELLISKGWVQAVALVVLFGFFVLGLLAYRAYSGQPPIPDRVVDPQGEVISTRGCYELD
jgi:nitric oxide reductase subunit B